MSLVYDRDAGGVLKEDAAPKERGKKKRAAKRPSKERQFISDLEREMYAEEIFDLLLPPTLMRRSDFILVYIWLITKRMRFSHTGLAEMELERVARSIREDAFWRFSRAIGNLDKRGLYAEAGDLFKMVLEKVVDAYCKAVPS
jgi:hypothetical protein